MLTDNYRKDLIMELKIVKADPSGNRTVLILDPVPQAQRQHVNAALLEKDPKAEQVACLQVEGHRAQVEMMGGEFCGNATRSAGAYALKQLGEKEGIFQVTCSGCPHPLPVSAKKVREKVFEASVRLDPPLAMTKFRVSYERESVECQKVSLAGIDHYVYFTLNLDTVDKQQLFRSLQREISRYPETEAYGLMLVEIGTFRMVPAVYVTATGTLYWENSCGSGSAAVAAAMAKRQGRSIAATLLEPGGKINIEALYKDDAVQEITIGGPVKFGEMETVTV